jgi:hypothetical protein
MERSLARSPGSLPKTLTLSCRGLSWSIPGVANFPVQSRTCMSLGDTMRGPRDISRRSSPFDKCAIKKVCVDFQGRAQFDPQLPVVSTRPQWLFARYNRGSILLVPWQVVGPGRHSQISVTASAINDQTLPTSQQRPSGFNCIGFALQAQNPPLNSFPIRVWFMAPRTFSKVVRNRRFPCQYKRFHPNRRRRFATVLSGRPGAFPKARRTAPGTLLVVPSVPLWLAACCV